MGKIISFLISESEANSFISMSQDATTQCCRDEVTYGAEERTHHLESQGQYYYLSGPGGQGSEMKRITLEP